MNRPWADLGKTQQDQRGSGIDVFMGRACSCALTGLFCMCGCLETQNFAACLHLQHTYTLCHTLMTNGDLSPPGGAIDSGYVRWFCRGSVLVFCFGFSVVLQRVDVQARSCHRTQPYRTWWLLSALARLQAENFNLCIKSVGSRVGKLNISQCNWQQTNDDEQISDKWI